MVSDVMQFVQWALTLKAESVSGPVGSAPTSTRATAMPPAPLGSTMLMLVWTNALQLIVSMCEIANDFYCLFIYMDILSSSIQFIFILSLLNILPLILFLTDFSI